MTEINVCWQHYWIHILSKNWSLASTKCWHGCLERRTIKFRIHSPSLICCAECSASISEESHLTKLRSSSEWKKYPRMNLSLMSMFWVFYCISYTTRHSCAERWADPLMRWAAKCKLLDVFVFSSSWIAPLYLVSWINPTSCLCLCMGRLWADLKVWKQDRWWRLLCWPLGGHRHSPWDQNIAIYYFLITWS